MGPQRELSNRQRSILLLYSFRKIFCSDCQAPIMEENQELKAGHKPAQKVAGMRIVQQKKADKHEGSPPKVSEDEKEDAGDEKPVKATDSVMVSGAKATEEAAFPADAVKSFHEKPMPTHDKGASQKPKIIQQPRK